LPDPLFSRDDWAGGEREQALKKARCGIAASTGCCGMSPKIATVVREMMINHWNGRANFGKKTFQY